MAPIVKKMVKQIASVFVPDGIYNIEEGRKLERAAESALAVLLPTLRQCEETVRDILSHDGGKGSKDYHAIKLYDARQEGFRLLVALHELMGDAATGDGAGGGVRSVDSSSPTPDNEPHWLFKDLFTPDGRVA